MSAAHYPAEHGVRDPVSRRRKADKLWAMLVEIGLPADPAALRVVDVGCAGGLIAARWASRVAWVVGVEYDAEALGLTSPTSPPAPIHEYMDREAGGEDAYPPPLHARKREPGGEVNLLLVCGDGGRLPIADGAAQVALCAQVYEHVPDAEALAAEIYRVLAPGGVCLFTGPNRLAPIEPHYGLPFLSWLPQRWANGYLCRAGLGSVYDIRPRTWWGLRRLLRRFDIHDLTPDLLRQPARFHCEDELGGLRWLGRLPAWLLRLAAPFYPNYNWVLVKRPACADQPSAESNRTSLTAES